MKKAIVYIHGKGGSADEAGHYKQLFPNIDVIGFDYKARTPWEAKNEFPLFFDGILQQYNSVSIIANSIGAFFSMHALADKPIEKALFVSPIVDMEKLIADMMLWADVSVDELRERREIKTSFGETLSWEYLCYVKNYPVKWKIPTYILYGKNDNLTSYETISEFAKKISVPLTVMQNGEHWFHTDEQMSFLDKWALTAE